MKVKLPEAPRMIRFPHSLENSFHDGVLAEGAFIGHMVKSWVQVIFFAVNFAAHVVKRFPSEKGKETIREMKT